MLTTEQIEYLFSFCRRHFVKYYDVQVELVDHLANAIESVMQADKKISFEQALDKVYKGFGVMGFASVVSERRRMVEKQNMKLFRRLFKAQFKWPKILTFFLLTAVFFTLFSAGLLYIRWIFISSMILAFPVYIVSVLKLQRIAKKSGKKFMAIDFSWVGSFLFMPTYLFNFSKLFEGDGLFNYMNPHIAVPCLSLVLSLYIIVVIAVCQTLSSVGKALYKTYPEVFPLAK